MNKIFKLETKLKCSLIALAVVCISALFYCLYASTWVKFNLVTSVVVLIMGVFIVVKFYRKEVSNNTVSFCLLNTNATIPTKRIEDAGYDIYACFSSGWETIGPHETKMIPTGIASSFNSKYVAVLKERGSTGTKGIGQRCGVIDSGYRGEWMMPITNHNDKPMVILKDNCRYEFKKIFEDKMDDFIIYPYEKAICQMIILPVPIVNIKSINKETLDISTSERGSGKLGSSGK